MRLGPMWFMLGVLAVAGLLDGQAARGFATEFGIGFPPLDRSRRAKPRGLRGVGPPTPARS